MNRTDERLERAWKEALTNDKVAKMINAVREHGATVMQRDWLRSYLAVARADINEREREDAPLP